jgi:hypothetical protein
MYWNNFDLVQHNINQAITGDRRKNWSQHVRDRYGCFEKGLFVNCGNGWVERDMFREAVIRQAIGFDIREPLIDAAIAEANRCCNSGSHESA